MWREEKTIRTSQRKFIGSKVEDKMSSKSFLRKEEPTLEGKELRLADVELRVQEFLAYKDRLERTESIART